MKLDDPSSFQQFDFSRSAQFGLPAAQFHLASTSALAIDAATDRPFLYIGLESTAQPLSLGRSAAVIHRRGCVVTGAAWAAGEAAIVAAVNAMAVAIRPAHRPIRIC